MLIGEAVAILGSVVNGAATVTGLHGWFTGLQAGRQLDEAIARLEQARKRIEILSDRILLAPWLQQVYPVGEEPQILVNRQQIRELSQPLADRLQTRILLGSVLSTPPKLGDALRKDPREVLIDVRPASESVMPAQPNLIPVLFVEDGKLHVGWQLRGALPLMLGCEYKPLDSIVSPVLNGNGAGEVDRVILDLPAIKTHLLTVHRQCRIVLTVNRLSFSDRENTALSWEIDRSTISRLRPWDRCLEIETVGGRLHRLEASSIVLEKVLEELRGF